MKTLDYLHLDEKKISVIVSELAQLLANFQVHYTNLRGYHWNVKGRVFFVLHEKFESMYDGVADAVDELAERILMLGGTPDNKFSDYLRIAQVKEVSGVSCGKEAIGHVLDTYRILIEKERHIQALASEAGDEVTASLMSDYLKEQEKMVWMLVAFSSGECEK